MMLNKELVPNDIVVVDADEDGKLTFKKKVMVG